MDIVDSFKYLGDEITSKGDYSVLCNNRAKRAVGTTTELIRGKIWEKTVI